MPAAMAGPRSPAGRRASRPGRPATSRRTRGASPAPRRAGAAATCTCISTTTPRSGRRPTPWPWRSAWPTCAPAARVTVEETMRRLRCLVLFVALFAPGPLAAQAWPQRTITIISPYPPGATNDMLARLVAPKLSETFGQSVVVENRTGASGNIGVALAARAAPDGYTLVIGNDATHATNVFLYKDIGFDPVTSFAPITLAARNIIGIALHPSVPVNDVPGLIAYARANPGKLSFGSSGTGSPHQLAGELLQHVADIKMTHVPYRRGGQAVVHLLGRHPPVMFPHLAAGMQPRHARHTNALAGR